MAPGELHEKGGEAEIFLLVVSCHGEPGVEITFDSQGRQHLKGVKYPSWQLIRLPCPWHDPDKSDEDPSEQLDDFIYRIGETISVWEESPSYLE
jgi:hypothetical protein